MAQNGAQKYIKVVRLFSTGGGGEEVVEDGYKLLLSVYTFVFFRLLQTEEEGFLRHERATFLRPFSRLCVPANNVQIGTY